MHPIRSIIVKHQNKTLKNFKKSKYGKAIKGFRDIHKGERCFFIGNGPSLKVEDLTVLHENNEITFAFNRIYNIFEDTPWRPTFYISQDEKMLKGCESIVNDLNLNNKFIPIQLKWYHNIKIKNAKYFNLCFIDASEVEKMNFSDDISHVMYCGNTVMYSAAQMAAYMGFKEIYLLGVDHHFRVSKNMKGEIVVDDKVKDYFTDKYNEDKNDLYIPNTEMSTLTYLAMKKHCDERNIKIFNATRGGALEVFDRVDFDTIIK